MIKRLGVKNFFCFDDGVELNFELDGKVPDDVRQGRSFTTVLGIKGANGSGKTNLVKAISFLKHFCTKSADQDSPEQQSNIKVKSFFGNPQPSEFYVDFSVNGEDYHYELEVDNQRIHSESLFCTTTKITKVFQRVGDEFEFLAADVKELSSIMLRRDASTLSIIKKYRFKSGMQHIVNACIFFSRIEMNVGFYGYQSNLDVYATNTSELFSRDESLFKFVKEIISYADPSIQDIQIDRAHDTEGKVVYFPKFIHRIAGQERVLSFHEEAEGTKSLYKSLLVYWQALFDGGLLALDEFDIHLHALILPKLLNLFLNKEINKHNAQLVFTAHNTEIIDTLGKYRTVLVNKDENASYCYRLDEIKGSMLRNDRTIIPLYLKGKIGGVPPKAFQ